MIDVHVPQKSEHTWTDFFIHIGTIAVGLLLAIGLEQGVEWLHHRHERVTLRQDLRQEDEKALRDNSDYIRLEGPELVWLGQRIAAVQAAIRDHKPVSYIPPPQGSVHSTPDDPVWRAAKSSNLIEVMPQEDIKAYSEIDGLFEEFMRLHLNNYEPGNALLSFEQQFRVSAQSPVLDLSSASRADLIEELRLLTSLRIHTREEYKWALYSDGALRAVLAGERNLDRIQDAENSTFEREVIRMRAIASAAAPPSESTPSKPSGPTQ